MNPFEVYQRDQQYYFTPSKDYNLQVGDYFMWNFPSTIYYGKVLKIIQDGAIDSELYKIKKDRDVGEYWSIVRFAGLQHAILENRNVRIRSKQIVI